MEVITHAYLRSWKEEQNYCGRGAYFLACRFWISLICAQDGLQGWDLMQDTILSHDEDMIADFADDIDTLLVFVSARFLSIWSIS